MTSKFRHGRFGKAARRSAKPKRHGRFVTSCCGVGVPSRTVREGSQKVRGWSGGGRGRGVGGCAGATVRHGGRQRRAAGLHRCGHGGIARVQAEPLDDHRRRVEATATATATSGEAPRRRLAIAATGERAVRRRRLAVAAAAGPATERHIGHGDPLIGEAGRERRDRLRHLTAAAAGVGPAGGRRGSRAGRRCRCGVGRGRAGGRRRTARGDEQDECGADSDDAGAGTSEELHDGRASPAPLGAAADGREGSV